MDFLINNWYLLLAMAAVIAAAACAIYAFFKQPKSEQMKKVQEWLLYAVIEAEKALGGGTGQIKLRYVYDMFVVRFAWLSKVITFEQFSLMVDQALEKMRKMLETNQKANAYVEEGKVG